MKELFLEILFLVGFIILKIIIDRDKAFIKSRSRIIDKIKKIWREEQLKNFQEASKRYPLPKNLIDNYKKWEDMDEKEKKEWEEVIDKQMEYSNKLDKISAQKIKNEYGLSDREWEKIWAESIIEDLKGSSQDSHYQKLPRNIKSKRDNK